MKKQLCLFLFLAFIIPSLDYRIWADMFPSLKQILLCESNLKSDAYNYDGGAHSRGIAQITRKYHPEVSDKQAYNPAWSFGWALNVWYKGDAEKEWSCYKIVKAKGKIIEEL